METVAFNREPLLKGKAQYNWPPCTNYFQSAAFDNANIFYFFVKQATLVRRSTVHEPFLPVRVPCFYIDSLDYPDDYY